MSEIKIPVKRSLNERLKDVLTSQRASMVPEPRHKKEEKPTPDLREVVQSPALRLKIIRLAGKINEWGEAEREAKRAKKEPVIMLKALLNDNGVKADRFMAGDNRINHYTMKRSTINVQKLLARGVPSHVIAECTDTEDVEVIKVGIPKQKDESEEDEL